MARLLAWSGSQYTGPEDDPDRTARTQLLAESLDGIRVLKESGPLPAEVDPACLLVMLMAAAMATTTLPQIIEGICGVDPRELIEHFADRMAVLGRLIGLGPDHQQSGR